MDNISDSTSKLYSYHWRRFLAWCASNNHVPLPAHLSTVFNFISTYSSHSSAKQAITSINFVHNQNAHPTFSLAQNSQLGQLLKWFKAEDLRNTRHVTNQFGTFPVKRRRGRPRRGTLSRGNMSQDNPGN